MKLFLIVLIATCSLIAVRAQNPPANPPAARQQPALAANVIENIEFRGLSRVPVDTVKALVHSKTGDVYNDEALRKDFNSLWNTGRFDDIRLKSEKGERGGLIVSFTVTERP
jgi:outer membrane protein insertion porin family